MSGAEVLAVIGIVSNILQLADFCAKITDRAVEFAGQSAELPGSFSDLRVVLAVVRLNLKRLTRRLESSEPDQETVETLQDLVTIIEREVNVVQKHLQKLPPPGSSWAKISVKAMISVFSEGKVKRATDSILQNVDLLSQTVTASLPTADEIAKAVHEKSVANGIDRKLSMILKRMQTSAFTKEQENRRAFDNRASLNRAANGAKIGIEGTTHINNTYINVQIPYKDLGAQLDKNAGNLTVPNQNLPFLLKHAISNPDLQKSMGARRESAPSEVLAAPMFGMTLDSPLDLNSGHYIYKSKAERSNTTKTYRHSASKSAIISRADNDYDDMDGETVVGSIMSSECGLSVPSKSYPQQQKPYLHTANSYPPPPKSPRYGKELTTHLPPTVPEEQLHVDYHELGGGPEPDSYMPPLTHVMSPSQMDAPSEVGTADTASSVWSDTVLGPGGHAHDHHHAAPGSSVGSVVEDTAAINTVNAYLRQGASAVTSNPTEAKRAYMSALSTCKRIVCYTPAFTIRKYRAMTQAAIGLALSTRDREKYLDTARSFNQQALSVACQAGNDSLEFMVLLDEADLQMREARMLEKSSRPGDATMKHFSAFGAYQKVATRVSEAAMDRLRRGAAQTYPAPTPTGHNALRSMSVADCNTHAQALMGSAKAAAALAKNSGSFTTMRGTILTPRAYYEQALAACKAGTEVGAAQAADAQARGDRDWAKRPAEELALLAETEELVMRYLVVK